MVKKKTSLVIDENLWQEVKIHCIKDKIDISDYLEKVIKKDLTYSKLRENSSKHNI